MFPPPDTSHEKALSIPAIENVLQLPTPAASHTVPSLTVTRSVDDELEMLRNCNNLLALETIQSHHSKRLLHQLILSVEFFLFDSEHETTWSPTTPPTPGFEIDRAAAKWKRKVEFCVNVLMPVKEKMDSMNLLKIVEKVALDNDNKDYLCAFKFLNIWFPAIKRDRDSLLLLRASQAYLLLMGGYTDECSEVLDILSFVVKKAFGLSVEVLSSFHRACMTRHCKLQDWDNYYKSAILYLACTSMNCIHVEDRMTIAFNLCKSVLISHKCYSFVELRQQNLVQWFIDEAQCGGPMSMIFELIRIFDLGDQVMFEDFIIKQRYIMEQAEIVDQIPFLRDKLKLFSLLELAWQKPQKSRILTFKEIEEGCHMSDPSQVEHLVLLSLAHGLLEGSIDGISQQFMVRRIQPRLLSDDKIFTMSNRFLIWSKVTGDLANAVENMSARPSMIV